MEVDQQAISLINGGLMKSYGGKMVHIWLNVEQSSSGGHQIQGTTTDKKTIKAKFESPLNQPVSGWVEVIGVSDGSDVNCSEIIIFRNDENSEPFDEEAHNQIVVILHSMTDFDIFGESDGVMDF